MTAPADATPMQRRAIDGELRLDLIEALLREHRMHEASCPVRRAQVHNARGMIYMFPGECDCWLGPATDAVGPATIDIPPASAP